MRFACAVTSWRSRTSTFATAVMGGSLYGWAHVGCASSGCASKCTFEHRIPDVLRTDVLRSALLTVALVGAVSVSVISGWANAAVVVGPGRVPRLLVGVGVALVSHLRQVSRLRPSPVRCCSMVLSSNTSGHFVSRPRRSIRAYHFSIQNEVLWDLDKGRSLLMNFIS